MFQASSRDLLSLAIERNDVSMVCLLLSHKAILHVTDTVSVLALPTVPTHVAIIHCFVGTQ